MIRTLGGSAMHAMRWNYGGFVCRSIAAIGVSVILARLLGPEPFGLIGVAALVFGLGNQIADAGVGSALVQAEELSERQIRSVFTAQLLIGVSMAVATYQAAPWIAGVYQSAAVTDVVRQTAPVFAFQSLGTTPTGLLKRRLAFKPVQCATILSYLVGYAGFALVLALAGYGVQSLIAAQLAQPIVYSAWVYANERHSIRPCLDRSGMRLLRFGGQVTADNVLNWTIGNMDNFAVGRTFGAVGLGLYSRAFNLASNPSEGFIGAVQQVLFATSSRVQTDQGRLRRAYLTCVSAVALVCLPIFLSCSVVSYTVITALYGSKWSEAAPFFLAFCMAMPFFCLMALAGPVLSAAGQVHQDIRAQALSLVVCAVLVWTAASVSPRAIAWSIVLAYAFRFWCVTRPVLLLLSLRWSDIWDIIAGAVWVGVFTASCVCFTAGLLSFVVVPPVFTLLVLSATGVIALLGIVSIAANQIVPWPVWRLLVDHRESIPTCVVDFLISRRGDNTRTTDYRDSRSTGVAL